MRSFLEAVLLRYTAYISLASGGQQVCHLPAGLDSWQKYSDQLYRLADHARSWLTFCNGVNPFSDNERNIIPAPVLQIFANASRVPFPVTKAEMVQPFSVLQEFLNTNPGLIPSYSVTCYRQEGYWYPESGEVVENGSTVGTASSAQDAFQFLSRKRTYPTVPSHSVTIEDGGTVQYLTADSIRIALNASSPAGVAHVSYEEGSFTFSSDVWDSVSDYTPCDTKTYTDMKLVYVPNYPAIEDLSE